MKFIVILLLAGMIVAAVIFRKKQKSRQRVIEFFEDPTDDFLFEDIQIEEAPIKPKEVVKKIRTKKNDVTKKPKIKTKVHEKNHGRRIK